MIAFLRGRLLEKHPNRVVVDVSGVGYDVHVPVSSFYGLGEPGGEVSLRVHTHVREDVIALFGFVTALELQLFERLIAVNGSDQARAGGPLGNRAARSCAGDSARRHRPAHAPSRASARRQRSASCSS